MGAINAQIYVGNSRKKNVYLRTTGLKNNFVTINESFFVFSYLDSRYHSEHFDIWCMYVAFVKLLKIVFVIVYVFVNVFSVWKTITKTKWQFWVVTRMIYTCIIYQNVPCNINYPIIKTYITIPDVYQSNSSYQLSWDILSFFTNCRYICGHWLFPYMAIERQFYNDHFYMKHL